MRHAHTNANHRLQDQHRNAHHQDDAHVTGGTGGRWLIGLTLAGAAAAAAYPHLRKQLNGAGDAEQVTLTTTIDRSAQEVYDFWMRFELFDQFIPHVKSVIKMDERLSDWTVEGPAGQELNFTSRITGSVPGERINWEVKDSVARHRGEVSFNGTARGTIVLLELHLQPPMGPLGRAVATLLGKPTGTDPKALARQALKQLKQLLETGEVARVPEEAQ